MNYMLYSKHGELLGTGETPEQAVSRARMSEIEIEKNRVAILDKRYELLARAECRRRGIDPDELIADGGHLAWSLVGYEASENERQKPKNFRPNKQQEMVQNVWRLCANMFGRKIATDQARRIVETVIDDLKE